jgi:oligopeptide/dipeptide ABC transporter ATP-binding protein
MTGLFSIEGLKVAVPVKGGTVEALRGVDLAVERGECLGLVGESGSGKSLSMLAAMGLLPSGAHVSAGRALFDGQDILALPPEALNAIRGRRIGMIFQEPMTALNPILTVAQQIGAPLRRHLGLTRAAARSRALDLLRTVGIPDPERRLDAYPHQLSGGMRQRVMIAMALSCDPAVLIADEPTTALDGTIQAQILDLLRRLRRDLGLAVIIITHDFGVIAELADRVAVMYGGRVVETGPVEALFDRPAHPYSAGLLKATPTLDAALSRRLVTVGGTVPHVSELPPGCSFNPRCSLSFAPCRERIPPMVAVGPGHAAACFARGPEGDAAGRALEPGEAAP